MDVENPGIQAVTPDGVMKLVLVFSQLLELRRRSISKSQAFQLIRKLGLFDHKLAYKAGGPNRVLARPKKSRSAALTSRAANPRLSYR